MSILETEYFNLAEDIAIVAAVDGTPKVEVFFKKFADLAAESGDCPDLTYTPVLGGSGYRFDGYAFDIPEGADNAAGDFYISVCTYFQNESLPTVNAKDIDKVVSDVKQFLKLAISNKSLDNLEETNHDYRLVLLLRSYIAKIARIRVIVFTNGHLKIRKNIFETSQIGEFIVHTNVFDLERYSKISSMGFDPVEIDFNEDFSGGIPCIHASGNLVGYKSFLFALPGLVLADIFATYGNRLLEQNVRTYLQGKTEVNKGILKTIKEEPSMFFAYNNGLTATATSVMTEKDSDGTLKINHIKDFQIVNGGQTTASILYARDGLKYNLSDVFVQVKLSVVAEEKLEEIIPNISKYANTQNKVSLADLASNSPAQTKIERISKEVVVPQRVGVLYASKWFYERARGQYKNLYAYKTQSQRNRLQLEFPKAQLIEKTDLAKFELSFEGLPYYVAQGAQKCFQKYITTLLKSRFESDEINETWYKFAVAKGILFRSLDSAISQSGWYKIDKGLKAQTVTYAIAACAHSFREVGRQIDLIKIWKEQDLSLELLDWMLDQAKTIHGILNSPPGIEKNPSEFCKKEFCWTLHVKGKTAQPAGNILDYGVTLMDFTTELSNGRRDSRRNNELDFEIALAKLVPRASQIKQMAVNRQMISPNNSSALAKLESGRLTFTRAEKNSLKTLLNNLEIDF